MSVVIWQKKALDELASLWVQAKDRDSVNQAVDRIDVELTANSEAAGESRDAGLRILLEPPLGVLFEPGNPHRPVFVLAVWAFAPRHPSS